MKTYLKNILWLLAAMICITSCDQEEVTDVNTIITTDGKIPVRIEIMVDGVITRASSEAGYTTGDGLYDEDDPVTVAAFANEGYELVRFYNKNGDASQQDKSSYSFPAKVPLTFKAEFGRKHTITVTASPTEGGTVSGGGKYGYGKSCTISAIANAGYAFDGWYEGSTKISSETNYTFTVSSSRTITGRFLPLKYLIMGENGYIISPTKTQQVGTNTWDGVAYGNGKYVAIGSGNNIPGYLTTSSDAIRWTIVERFSWNLSLPSIAYGNGKYIVTTGGASGIYTSNDGYTWGTTGVSDEPSGQTFKVYFINGLFFVLADSGYTGEIYSSPDGKTWTKASQSFDSANMRSIVYGNGTYYVIGYQYSGSTRIYSSTDGIAWTLLGYMPNKKMNKMAYGNGKLVAIGDSYCSSSVDGKKWTTPQKFTGFSEGFITFASGKFIAVQTYGGRFSTSIDGETWTTPEQPKDDSGNLISFRTFNLCAVP